MSAFVFLSRLTAASFLFLMWSSCASRSADANRAAPAPLALPAIVPEYWYQGKAEISTFDIEQRRYGQMRRGQQVNIFVTEDFSAQKQVKLDHPEAAGADRVPVLKLNALRRFTTGIYDYSLMTSVFFPTDPASPRALKASWSIQDWCGQVFTQANRQPDGSHRFRSFSYFESEGDTESLLRADWLEEEIWTALRLNPGRFERIEKAQVVPALTYFRFQHQPLKAYDAALHLEKGERESKLYLRYAQLPRSLLIRFETAWPHRILGWEETDGGHITSRATLRSVRMDAYWKHNDNASSPLRDSLGLRFF